VSTFARFVSFLLLLLGFNSQVKKPKKQQKSKSPKKSKNTK